MNYAWYFGILARSNCLNLKCHNDGFISYKHVFLFDKTLIDGLELCGYIFVLLRYFESAVWTIILTRPIHCS